MTSAPATHQNRSSSSDGRSEKHYAIGPQAQGRTAPATVLRGRGPEADHAATLRQPAARSARASLPRRNHPLDILIANAIPASTPGTTTRPEQPCGHVGRSRRHRGGLFGARNASLQRPSCCVACFTAGSLTDGARWAYHSPWRCFVLSLAASTLRFHPPSPCFGLMGPVTPGAQVSLNPQPIPPGALRRGQ